MKSKLIIILSFFIIINNLYLNSQDGTNIIPIYITLYYDCNGPIINVGKYSKNILNFNKNNYKKELEVIINDWDNLPVEAMYVISIRLYDLGLKDDSVYWFYSAQFRHRLFFCIINEKKMGSLGSVTFELYHAY